MPDIIPPIGSDAEVDAALVQSAPPEIDERTAARIASEGWGVSVRARALGSHQDRNFLLESDDGRRLLLKVANPSVTAAELEAQSAAAAAIAELADTRAPRALILPSGATAREVTVDGVAMQARVLEFLDGETLEGYLSPAVVRAMGALAARVAQALATIDPLGAERVHQWDLRHAPSVLDELLPFVDDPLVRARLSAAASEAWTALDVVAERLPVQLIHGDLTDDNVVTADPRTRLPDGVIDLGDLNRTWTVGELAITVSSLLHHDGVDLPIAMEAIAAYHRVRPLDDAEIAALWPLVVVRGVTLVASAHHVLTTDPRNVYAAENLEHERAIFDAATSVPLAVATALVSRAVGRHPASLALPEGGALFPDLAASEVAVVDLSATSPLLDEGRWLEASVEQAVFDEARRGREAATAPFGQARLTRSRPYAPEAPTNVALGVEMHLAARRTIVSPWDAVVSATPAGLIVRAESITLRIDGASTDISDETPVRAGEPIGAAAGRIWITCGRAGLDVPAFVPSGVLDAWRTVVADPGALVPGHPAVPPLIDGTALLARRDAVFADVQEHYFADPPVFVRGWREFLVDTTGRVHLDTLNNVTAVGHAHPRVVDASHEQWRLLNTNSRFHYPSVVEFAERLASLLPEPLDTVFLVNSGSEAIDLALRLAQVWTGRRDVLAVREAYHGWTYLTDAVSTSIADNPMALETRPEWVHTVAAPIGRRNDESDDGGFATAAVEEVERLAAAGSPVGAFLAESVFGNAGGAMLPDGYLDAVYRAVRAGGGLAIADEVQVGYGRLGDWFWGFEQQGVVPDIVGVAKAMGNGHPLGAVITTRAIAERYRSGGYFFSSAGGSPVSCAVGLAVLDVIRDEKLQQNAQEVGRYLRAEFERLGERHPIIAAVHGSGFYLGPELIRDRASWEPATFETEAICTRLRELGVIAQPTGDHQNILKIKPPMCFSRASADALIAALDRVLTTGW